MPSFKKIRELSKVRTLKKKKKKIPVISTFFIHIITIQFFFFFFFYKLPIHFFLSVLIPYNIQQNTFMFFSTHLQKKKKKNKKKKKTKPEANNFRATCQKQKILSKISKDWREKKKRKKSMIFTISHIAYILCILQH